VTLVDTSSWVEALRESGDRVVRERVRALLENGEAAWCDMVRLELWNSATGPSERRALKIFDRDLPCLEIGPQVWPLACELARKARAAGLTLPSTDLLVLACARHHQVPLEHCDSHFTQAERKLTS
jgi:predicted nucleic acid-binding protein